MENHSCRSMQDVHDSHAVSLPLFHDRSRWSSQSLLRLIQNLGFFLQTPKVNRQKYYKLWKSYQPLHLHELELCVCSGDLAGWWKTPIFIKEPTITISSDAVWQSDKTLCFEAYCILIRSVTMSRKSCYRCPFLPTYKVQVCVAFLFLFIIKTTKEKRLANA